MVASVFASSYQGYTMLICIMSGIMLLGIDAPSYKASKLLKEQKTARALGWFNLALCGAAFLVKILVM